MLNFTKFDFGGKIQSTRIDTVFSAYIFPKPPIIKSDLGFSLRSAVWPLQSKMRLMPKQDTYQKSVPVGIQMFKFAIWVHPGLSSPLCRDLGDCHCSATTR